METNDKVDPQYNKNKALLETLTTTKSKEYIIKTKNLFEKFENKEVTPLEYAVESEKLRSEYRKRIN